MELVDFLHLGKKHHPLLHGLLARAWDENVAIAAQILCLNVDLHSGKNCVVSFAFDELTHDNVRSIPVTYPAAWLLISF